MRKSRPRGLKNHKFNASQLARCDMLRLYPHAVGKTVKQKLSHIGSRLQRHLLYIALVTTTNNNGLIVVGVKDCGTPLGSRIVAHGIYNAIVVGYLVCHHKWCCRTATVLGWGVSLRITHLKLSLTVGKVFNKAFCYGNFILGCLGQRYTNRISYTVGKQCANAHCALYTPLNATACLRNSEVYWECHILALHSLHQEAIGVYHNACIARLHRDDDLVKVLLHADSQKLHSRGDHTLRGVAILVKYMFGK